MDLITFDTMLPGATQWELLSRQASALLQSGLLPSSLKRPEQVIVVILKGRELGIPPMQALEHIHVISGKPTMSAELMLAQILKLHPATKISYPEMNNERCVIEVTRAGNKNSLFGFTVDDAQRAGLTSNPSWKKYPRAMCRSRAIAEMARAIFPDALAGVSYTPEELGAVVDEDGLVVEVQTVEPIEPTKYQPVDSEDFTDTAPLEVVEVAAGDQVSCRTVDDRIDGMLSRFATVGLTRFDIELELGKKCVDFTNLDYDKAYSYYRRAARQWEQNTKSKFEASK